MSHAAQRAAERYGLTLTHEDFKALKRQIKSGDCSVESTRRDECQRIVVIYKGKALFCIWRPDPGFIVTVYPHGWNDKPMRKRTKREEKTRSRQLRTRSAEKSHNRN